MCRGDRDSNLIRSGHRAQAAYPPVRGARTTILITGGAGFIGSNFVRAVQRERPEWRSRVLDSLTYAGDKRRLAGIDLDFVVGDIADPESARLAVDGADLVVNFAAESHVDRSLLDASDFMRANVAGAYTIMRAAVDAGVEKFVQVSTDEDYGESRGRAFTERDILSPRSPNSSQSTLSATARCRSTDAGSSGAIDSTSKTTAPPFSPFLQRAPRERFTTLRPEIVATI